MLLSLSYLYSGSYSRRYTVRLDLQSAKSQNASTMFLFAEEYVDRLVTAVYQNALQEFRDTILEPDVLMLDGVDVTLDGKEATQRELYYLLRKRHELGRSTYLFACSGPDWLKEHVFLPELVSIIKDGQVKSLDDEDAEAVIPDEGSNEADVGIIKE